MGGLRRLKRRSAHRYEVEPLQGDLEAAYWEPEDWKLSTRILEIAKPLTDKAVDNDEFETMVRMAALCWNIALLPADQQEQRLRSLIDETMAKHEPQGFVSEAQAWGRVLLDRKRKLFGNDRRMVVDYTMERVGGSLRFHVVAGFAPR
jgi:hypothetical protein